MSDGILSQDFSGACGDPLNILQARVEITDVILRYCKALDSRDKQALRRCFHADSQHDHGGFVGTSWAFCDFAITVLNACVVTQHFVSGNIMIAVHRHAADAESYFWAYHRMPPNGDPIFPYASPDDDVIMAGRYIDRFEKRDGVWRIAQRRGTLDWLRVTPGCDRGTMAHYQPPHFLSQTPPPPEA